MSSSSHLTVASTIETKTDKKPSDINRLTPSSDGSSNLLHVSSTPRSNSKYLYYVNVEPTTQKPSVAPTASAVTAAIITAAATAATTTTTTTTATTTAATTLSPTPMTQTLVTSNSRRKLSSISLSVPWYKRTRVPSDDKIAQKAHKPPRDRLLPLDKLFNSSTSKSSDGDQTSPLNDIPPLDEPVKHNEKNIRHMKENGYLHNTSHLMTR